MTEPPLYLFDIDLAFLAPDPVEPPAALNFALDMVTLSEADGLDMHEFFRGPPNNF